MVVFIDTNVFIAYANVRDGQHKKAVNLMERIMSLEYGAPVTSDYVFDEAVTVALARSNDKDMAITLGNHILASMRMLKMNAVVFVRAWRRFKTAHEKMSFTDCTNLAFLEIIKDKRIATFDKEFDDVSGVEVIT